MRGKKVRALKQLYMKLQQRDRPEGMELVSFRKLKKVYQNWSQKQKRSV